MARFFDNLVAYRKQLDDALLLQPALEALSIRGAFALSTRPAFADEQAVSFAKCSFHCMESSSNTNARPGAVSSNDGSIQ